MGFVKKALPMMAGGLTGMAIASATKKKKSLLDPNRPIESGSMIGDYDREQRKKQLY